MTLVRLKQIVFAREVAIKMDKIEIKMITGDK
jgi:hypothetical protein